MKVSAKSLWLVSIILMLLVTIFVSNSIAAILYEDFEDGTLDQRISVTTTDISISAGIKDITEFGSTRAFGFGTSDCPGGCGSNYMATLKIDFGSPTYVSGISFKEMELYSNAGSGGKIFVDGQALTGGDFLDINSHDFGRLPYNDGFADTTYRTKFFQINQYVTVIELSVWDITMESEIFIDDLAIYGNDCISAPTNMVSWWKAENNANDSVGTNHGTLMNGATYATGMVGQAFSFDGVDDYVNVGNASSLKPAQFTLDAWVKATAFPRHYNVVVTHGFSTGVVNPYFLGFDSNGTLQFITYHNSIGTHITVAPGPIAANEWHHIAATFDGTTKKLYIDGGLVASDTVSYAIVYDDTPVLIGEDIDRGSPAGIPFSGLIDEVEIFNRALPTEEIAAIYNAGSAGKCFTADTTPDAFTFSDQTGVNLSTVITSNTITVSGINSATPISISNCTGTNCEYQINGGSWTSVAGTVLNGDTVTVRQTSSSNYSTQTELTLDIGGVTDTFSVTTIAPPQRTLTATKSGTGSGNVSATGCTLTWTDNTGTCTVNDGTAITLSGSADAGSTFTGWSGGTGSASGCSGSGNCSFNLTADSGVTATFTLNQYTIATIANPSAGGSVSCSPNPVNHGSTSTCTITTNTGYTLQNVTGTCGGTLSGSTYTTSAITGDCTVQANFTINQYTLTVIKAGTGAGTVTSNPAGIDCGTDCTEAYDYNTVVTLTATSDTGSTFTGWSGDADCSDGQVTIDANKTCTATFESKPDLTGSWTAMTKKIIKSWSSYRGESIKGTLKVANIGNSQVPSGVRILFYLSNDGASLNKYITVANTSLPINPNSYINVPFTYYSRSSVTGKYVIAVIDSNNQIDEVSETNNNIKSNPLP